MESRKCEWIQARHDSGLPVTQADKKAGAHCSRFQPDGRGHLSTQTAASCPTMVWAVTTLGGGRIGAARERPGLLRGSSSGHTDPQVWFGGSLSTGMTGGGFVTNPGQGTLIVDEPLSLGPYWQVCCGNDKEIPHCGEMMGLKTMWSGPDPEKGASATVALGGL